MMGAGGGLPRLPECGELPFPLCLNDLADELFCADDLTDELLCADNLAGELLCADNLAGERLALNVTRLLLERAIGLLGCALTIARVTAAF